jgi:hypothetical protein
MYHIRQFTRLVNVTCTVKIFANVILVEGRMLHSVTVTIYGMFHVQHCTTDYYICIVVQAK